MLFYWLFMVLKQFWVIQGGTEVTDELCSHPGTAEDMNWELGFPPLPPAQLLGSHFRKLVEERCHYAENVFYCQ